MVRVEISGEELLPSQYRFSEEERELFGTLFCRVVSEFAPQLTRHGDVEVSVNILSETEMAEINSQYRSEGGPTDVLSFPFWEDAGVFSPPMQAWPELPLGDILVCAEQVEKNAADRGVTFGDEYILVIVHGFLHLIGFDHDTKEKEHHMWNLQEKYTKELKLLLEKSRNGKSNPDAKGV
jgi:probable rRNA maturation factor